MINTGIVIQKTIAQPNNREIYLKYMADISKYKKLTREEEYDCFEKLQAGDLTMREKILKHNLLFVVSVAKQYQKVVLFGALTLEDLIAEGNIGLCKAIKTFDHTKKFKFISYAIFQIKHDILDCIIQNIKLIRIPKQRQTLLYHLYKLKSEIEQNINDIVVIETLAESAVKTGLIEEKNAINVIANLITESKFTKSLSHTINAESDIELIDTLINEDAELPNTKLLNDEITINFNHMLNTCTPHVKEMINLYYGLTDEDPMTLKKIGEKYELSSVRIGQIISQNLRRIRRRFNTYQYNLIPC